MKTMKENKLTFENHGSKEVDPILGILQHITQYGFLNVTLFVFISFPSALHRPHHPASLRWTRQGPITKATGNLLSRFDPE